MFRSDYQQTLFALENIVILIYNFPAFRDWIPQAYLPSDMNPVAKQQALERFLQDKVISFKNDKQSVKILTAVASSPTVPQPSPTPRPKPVSSPQPVPRPLPILRPKPISAPRPKSKPQVPRDN